MKNHRIAAALMLAALCALGPRALGQTRSYEGTEIGAVISSVKVKRVDFSGTTDAGPWAAVKKKQKPSLAVVALGSSEKADTPVVMKAASVLAGFFSNQAQLTPIPQKTVSRLLTGAGLRLPASGTDKTKAINLALSTYDIVVFTLPSEGGFLQIASYRAISRLGIGNRPCLRKRTGF